jgi:GxxExxY protein
MNGDVVVGLPSRYDGALRWVSEAILGGFYRVHRELGPGFLESVYEAAVAIVLRGMGLQVEQQATVNVHFRGVTVGVFRIDLLVESAIAVELKASRTLDPAHEAQLLNYLRASNLEVGLLLNFGQRPSFKRLVFSNDRKHLASDGRTSTESGEQN